MLDIGIVAKIDMFELRAPFLEAAAISGAGGILILLIGAALFRQTGMPLVRRLETAVDNLKTTQRIAKVGSWEWDVRGDKVWVSDETVHLFGRNPETYKGNFTELQESIHPDDKALVRESNRRVLKGRPLAYEHRIVLPGGDERIVRVRGEAHQDKTGRTVHVSGSVQDITEERRAEVALRAARDEFEHRVRDRTRHLEQEITERKSVEEALRESEERFRSGFENAAVGMGMVDLDGRF